MKPGKDCQHLAVYSAEYAFDPWPSPLIAHPFLDWPGCFGGVTLELHSGIPVGSQGPLQWTDTTLPRVFVSERSITSVIKGGGGLLSAQM